MSTQGLADRAKAAVAAHMLRYELDASEIASISGVEQARIDPAFHDGVEELTPADFLLVARGLGVHPVDLLIGAS